MTRMYENVRTWNPFVGCLHECSYCLTGDALILLADYSWQPLSSIVEGDALLTISEFPVNGRRQVEIAKVENTFSRKAKCIEVKTKNGSLTGSFEHPVLINSGRWRSLSNLKLGWNLSLFCAPCASPIENESFKKGYITGVTEGDGTVSFTEKKVTYREKQRYWRVALTNIQILERLREYLKSFNLPFDIKSFDKGCNYPVFKLETRRYATLVEIKKILETIPDLDFKKGYLAGIYDAEGNLTGPNLRISNYNPMIRDKIMKYGIPLTLDFYEETYKGRCKGVRLRGGQPEFIKFFCMVNPTKKKPISLKILHPEPICSLKVVGEKEIFNLETSTRTFIANGYVVHNCYARRIAKRQKHRCDKCYIFSPHLHPERLTKEFKAGETFFISSMGDISFATTEEMEQIMAVVRNHPKTTFMIQSKRHEYFLRVRVGMYTDNCILGTTIETNRNTRSISKAPLPIFRKMWMSAPTMHPRKYVTIEPIMEFDLDVMVEWIQEINPEFVYVGYNNMDSKNFHLPEPSLKKTLQLIKDLEKITEVRRKSIRKAWWEIENENNEEEDHIYPMQHSLL